MSSWVANARMYAVTPAVETAWRTLLAHIARDADVELSYLPHPAPQPLERLWSRPDLGAVLMCGYPIALGMASVVPLAAPVPDVAWAEGAAVYRTDLIVRRDAPFRRLADTFGGHAGWTVEHSQSGFNAFRHHLLSYRTPERPALYARMSGNLITARNVLDSVRAGRIDLGPLDAYWHLLMARHAPEITAGIRVLESTPLTPMPPFVAAAAAPADMVARLREAFVEAARRPWFAALAAPLQLLGFAPADAPAFAPLRQWDLEARAAGFERPA